MSPLPTDPRGMYFEEFQSGQLFSSAGRTITEADIVNFAGVSGDFTQIHTDEQYAKGTPIGKRVAHGVLGIAIMTGLVAQTGVLEGTVILFREIKNWKFIKTIFIGDTVHLVLLVSETKAIPRIGGGNVDIIVDMKNQDDDTVMKGVMTVIMATKPE